MSEDGLPTEHQLERLVTSMDALSLRIEEVRDELHKANLRTRILKVVSVLLAIVLVVVGAAVYETRQATRTINTERAERTTIGCVRDNVETAGFRFALVTTLARSISVLAEDPDNLTAQEQAVLDVYTDAARDTAAEALPYRDCSPAGIEAWFSSTPIDPATTTTVAGDNNPTGGTP